MSGSKRKRLKRNFLIRGITAGVMLAAAMLIFIFMIINLRNYGVTAQTIQYGFALVVLFFGIGITAGPVVKHWNKMQGAKKEL